MSIGSYNYEEDAVKTNDKNSLSTEFRKKIYNVVRKMMRTTRNFEFRFLNEEKLENDGIVIYSVNHSNCHDLPTIAEISNEHFFLLAGKQRLRLLDKLAFFLIGTVYVDRKNKIDRNKTKEKLIDLSSKGNNLLIFPEGTWNVSPNKLVLPLNWGIIEIAKASGAKIKPINLEYIGNICYVNVGDDIVVSPDDDKKEKIEELKEAMATLKWETIEKNGVFPRCTITEKDFESYTTDRFDEYKSLDVKYEQEIIRKECDSEEEVFEHFRHIELNPNNAFLAKGQAEYLEKYDDSIKRR